MSRVKLPSTASVRKAPPIAIRAPPTISATYCVRATEMPATSAASKFSPTACSRMPSPVEPSTHQATGASTRKPT